MRTINSGGSDNASRQPLNNRLAQFLEGSQERLLTIEEVASIYSVTTSAIHKRVQRGHLNIYKSERELSVGGQGGVELIRHNINTKIIIKFRNIPVKTRISAFSVIYANGPYFTLSDININWK